MDPFLVDLRQRFFSKISPGPGSCIDWIGAARPSGYGRLSVDGKLANATHVSWRIKHGEWPEQKLLHTCDRPVCVNPDHLFEGSDQDNADDRGAKGRGWQKLTGLEVSEILALTETRMSLSEIAALYGITPGYVSSLRHGRYRSRGQGAVPTKPMAVHAKAVIAGETLTLQEVAERFGVPLVRVRSRYARGMRDDALIKAKHSR